MKTKIILIRHAQSTANYNSIFGGITDFDLSEFGYKQAQTIIPILSNYNIEKIYSSPLKRTIQTVKPFAEYKNLNIEINNNLREVDLGDAENIKDEEFSIKYKRQFEFNEIYKYYNGIPNQEPIEYTGKRMYNAIIDIAKQNIGKTILIASHYCALRAFLCKALGIDYKDMRLYIKPIENAGIVEIEYDSNTNKFIINE